MRSSECTVLQETAHLPSHGNSHTAAATNDWGLQFSMQQQSAAKRPAPRASPMPVQQQNGQQPVYQYQQTPENPDFNLFDFSTPFNAEQLPVDANGVAQDSNNLSYLQNTSQAPTYGSNLAAAPSTDLVRRARNQQLATQNGGQQQQEQWNGGFGAMDGHAYDEDEQDLATRVSSAKRDAQGKKKSIPPFVQKLSSFLDSSHTDLIRWSDDGRSFIVLDEDEFARTLIPELFKHNNYASFVRQLNMYGFHKTVNITDGSLRQSEKARKGVKPPSMYSHPYFRRNRGDLLWLIQKPTTKAGSKRKRDGNVKEQYDSDDERQVSPPGPPGPSISNGPVGELNGGSAGQDVAALPRNELNTVRRELLKLQNQQRYISQMITQLKEQNDQFYRQASTFQALHDRHENSINAILTFLATFYNRSLEGHGAANLVNMFSNINQNQPQQGSVEEVHDGTPDASNQQLQRYKKPPLLLPGIANLQQQPGSAVTAPSSARTSVSPPHDGARDSTSSAPPDRAQSKSTTTSPVIKDDAPTPNVLDQIPERDEMMSLINSVNATNASTPSTAAPAFDFSSALEHYQTANGNAPLTPQQRDNMLALMGSHTGADVKGSNALTSPAPTMPDMNQFRQTQQQLEMLTNMQKRQDDKVMDLQRRLQPLSPTGSIPGLAGGGEDVDPFSITGAPGDYDPNAFINFDDSSWNDIPADSNPAFDFSAPPEDGGIDWNFGASSQDGEMFQQQPDSGRRDGGAKSLLEGVGRVESVSSEATSPAQTLLDAGEEPGTPRKRVRRSG
ncbi:Heat shock transcription factor [Elasticomyces elasticus]|nr:Heat shock transcription factor [Elasticomyces elasticus]